MSAWTLTVEFEDPEKQEWWIDGSTLDYALQLAREARKQWEHDDERSSLMEGRGWEDELMWRVSEDHTKVEFWCEILDALVDLTHQVLMRTIPLRMTLEQDSDNR